MGILTRLSLLINLTHLLLNIAGTLIGLFSQIKTGGDVVRERAIKFLLVKIKTEGSELLDKEAESHLLEEIKLCMGEVSK